MIYVKFLSATCAIGATLAIAVALRTKAAPPDSRGTALAGVEGESPSALNRSCPRT